MSEYLTTAAEVGVVITAGLIAVRMYNSRRWGWCSYSGSLEGKTYIVTGASSGLGYQTARQLLKQGATVILGCRDEGKTNKVMKELSEEMKAENNITDRIIFKHLDLESFESVCHFVNDVSKSFPVIDCVISNAGVYSPPFKITQDGFDVQTQVNHFAPALLHLLLLEKLRGSKDPRIVVVSSTRSFGGKVREGDFDCGSTNSYSYQSRKGYDNSKLYSRLFHQELADKIRQLPKSSTATASKSYGVKVFMASPGLVYTNLFRHSSLSWMESMFFLPVAIMFMRSARRGCQTILEAAINPSLSLKESGRLLRDCRVSSGGNLRHDDQLRVYNLTMEALKSTKFLPEHLTRL